MVPAYSCSSPLHLVFVIQHMCSDYGTCNCTSDTASYDTSHTISNNKTNEETKDASQDSTYNHAYYCANEDIFVPMFSRWRFLGVVFGFILSLKFPIDSSFFQISRIINEMHRTTNTWASIIVIISAHADEPPALGSAKSNILVLNRHQNRTRRDGD